MAAFGVDCDGTTGAFARYWLDETVTIAVLGASETATIARNRIVWSNIALELDDAVSDSLAQLARMEAFGVDPLPEPLAPLERIAWWRWNRPLPRGKLRRWRSLNEKRRAWGTR